MRRREFITLLGGAAAAWPLVARAQQPAIPVIGFLRSTSATDSEYLVTAFRAGLREAGFVEGQNVASEFRYAEGQGDRLPALAADLVRRPVSVIVGNSAGAIAAKAATKTVPIVFAYGGDPVGAGLVSSLNRPEGNVTGVVFITGTLGSKRLELFRQIVPKATKIGLLVHPKSAETEMERNDVQAAAHALGQQLITLDVNSDRDVEAAFATFVQGGAGALFVGTGTFTFSKREQLVALAAHHRLPASYAGRQFASIGGFMSYSADMSDAYRQVGIYTGRILKGEKPADLPVTQSTKIEFVINLRTARALGLSISPSLIALADEVIE